MVVTLSTISLILCFCRQTIETLKCHCVFHLCVHHGITLPRCLDHSTVILRGLQAVTLLGYRLGSTSFNGRSTRCLDYFTVTLRGCRLEGTSPASLGFTRSTPYSFTPHKTSLTPSAKVMDHIASKKPWRWWRMVEVDGQRVSRFTGVLRWRLRSGRQNA